MGINDVLQIERIQLQFCKDILGVRSQTQNNFIYGELGRYPLKIICLVNVIRYWLKIVESPETKYIKATYNMMINDLELYPN